jgi:hypothetical protein
MADNYRTSRIAGRQHPRGRPRGLIFDLAALRMAQRRTAAEVT